MLEQYRNLATALGHILQKKTFYKKPPTWRFFAFWACTSLPALLDQIHQPLTFRHRRHRLEEPYVLLNMLYTFSNEIITSTHIPLMDL